MLCLLLVLGALKDGLNGCGPVLDWNILVMLLTALATKLVLTNFEDSGEPLLTVHLFG